jgi:hypothetical protein
LVEQRIWRVRTNQELRVLYRDLYIVAVIKKVEIGMDWTCSRNGSGKDSEQNILRGETERSRRRGRPRLRWLEDVERDVEEMKVKRWRQKAVDREELALLLSRPWLSEGRIPGE